MKWTIDKSRLPAFVRVETSGKPDLDGLISMWDDIVDSAFWEPGLTILIDDRKLTQIPEPDKFTEATIDFFAENKETIAHACIAALSSQRDSFKYARQFQYGIRLRGSEAVIQLFISETQALQWLDHFCKVRDDQPAKFKASHTS
jgi:hypothetical protein